MRILIVRPMKYPEEAEISGDLQSMQRVVGGLIQSLSPFPEDTRCDLICNDEGKLMGLPPNRFIKDGSRFQPITCGILPWFLGNPCMGAVSQIKDLDSTPKTTCRMMLSAARFLLWGLRTTSFVP